MKNIISKELNTCLNCKNTPCKYGCPLNNDIGKIIKYLKLNNYEKAYFILSKTTVLPSICGIICPKYNQCERMCKKVLNNNHVKIGNIESFLGNHALSKNYKIYSPKKTKYHVLVIGSGPSSLTCAAFLRRNGINVDIYEKHNYLGGLLIHGIPEFRLSKTLVNDVIKRIIDLGINVFYNKELNKDFYLEDVINSYDAIYLGIGANVSNKLDIEGINLNNIYGANEFLENNIKLSSDKKEIIIYGGGETALDVALTLKNNFNVTILYYKDQSSLKIQEDEYKNAIKKKVKFIFNHSIIKIHGSNSIEKIELLNTLDNTKCLLNCDYLITAIGSHPNELVTNLNLNLTSKNYIDIDGNGHTSNEKIFAGGDVANIKSTVAFASRSGRTAAYSIIDYLKKEDL